MSLFQCTGSNYSSFYRNYFQTETIDIYFSCYVMYKRKTNSEVRRKHDFSLSMQNKLQCGLQYLDLYHSQESCVQSTTQVLTLLCPLCIPSANSFMSSRQTKVKINSNNPEKLWVVVNTTKIKTRTNTHTLTAQFYFHSSLWYQKQHFSNSSAEISVCLEWKQNIYPNVSECSAHVGRKTSEGTRCIKMAGGAAGQCLPSGWKNKTQSHRDQMTRHVGSCSVCSKWISCIDQETEDQQ